MAPFPIAELRSGKGTTPSGLRLNIPRRSASTIAVRGSLRFALWLALLVVGFACGRSHTEEPSSAPPPGSKAARRAALDREADQFLTGPVRRFEITVSREFANQLRRDPRKYVPATVVVGDRRFDNVALHLKGAAGSRRSFDDKPGLTLNFDKFKSGQHCFGLDKLHLNNSVQDDSYLNEIVASELYRRSGVQTARATHALVTLNGRDLGLYVLKEGYDALFLRRNFPSATGVLGNLYDGGFLRDVDHDLELDAGEGPSDWRDLRALVKAAEEPLSSRSRSLETVLDIDQFLLFLAGQTLTDDWDGYGRNRNNYRLYFRPDEGRAVFIPHGMDQLFREPGSSVNPHWSALVSQHVMEVPEFRERYRQRLAWMVTNSFTAPQISNQLQQVVGRLQDAFQNRPPNEWRSLERALRSQQAKIFRRIQYVERQLGLAASLASVPPKQPGPNDWEAQSRSGAVTLEVVQLNPGGPALHLASRRRGTVGSFRTRIWLPPGQYQFSGNLRVRGVQGGNGAGLRISGRQRPAGLSGERDWSRTHFDFSLDEEREVELVVELGSDTGEAWFDCASLKVIPR